MSNEQALVDRVIKASMVKDEETGKLACKFCSVLYKADKHGFSKALFAHIGIGHQSKVIPLVMAEKQRIKQSHIELCQKKIDVWFSDIEKAWFEKKEKFLKKLAEQSISSTLQWDTEDMVKAEKIYSLAVRGQASMEKYKKENGAAWFIPFRERLEQSIKEQNARLLESPPRHSNTSQMNNVIEGWEFEAACSFYSASSLSGSGLGKLCYVLQELEKEMKEEVNSNAMLGSQLHVGGV